MGEVSLFVVIWLSLAIGSAVVAGAKGRSAFGWLILGFLLPLIAFVIVAVLPSKRRDPNAPQAHTHVRCPDCKEFVLNEAKVCKHCGRKLVPQSKVRAIAEEARVAALAEARATGRASQERMFAKFLPRELRSKPATPVKTPAARP